MKCKVINQGWECPKCGTVYAPWVAVCRKCKNTSIGYEYTVGTKKTHEIIKKMHEPRKRGERKESEEE